MYPLSSVKKSHTLKSKSFKKSLNTHDYEINSLNLIFFVFPLYHHVNLFVTVKVEIKNLPIIFIESKFTINIQGSSFS